MKVPQITSTPEEFTKSLETARRIVNSWPKWKREIPATSYPRPQLEVEAEEER